MSAKVIFFSDLSDAAITTAIEYETLLKQHMPVQLFTDRKCLFDVISKGSQTSEKCTMIDIAASWEAFRERVISDVGSVHSSKNIADSLTKIMNQAALRTVLRNRSLYTEADQCIVRDSQEGNGHRRKTI